MHRRPLQLICLLAAALLISTACGRGQDPAIDNTGTISPRVTPTAAEEGETEAASPSLTIASPQDGARVPAGSVEIRIDASNFQVVDKLGQPPTAGEGHVHFYMDVPSVPTESGKPAVTARGTYHATATTSHTWTEVAPGEHTFSVQLVNNDHTPLSPPVFKTITVNVTG